MTRGRQNSYRITQFRSLAFPIRPTSLAKARSETWYKNVLRKSWQENVKLWKIADVHSNKKGTVKQSKNEQCSRQVCRWQLTVKYKLAHNPVWPQVVLQLITQVRVVSTMGNGEVIPPDLHPHRGAMQSDPSKGVVLFPNQSPPTQLPVAHDNQNVLSSIPPSSSLRNKFKKLFTYCFTKILL